MNNEILLVTTSLLIILIYHIYLGWMLHCCPLRTDMGINRHVGALWVKQMMKHKPDVLTVQSLRNLVMTASLLATSSLLLVGAILGLMLDIQRLQSFNYTLDLLGDPTDKHLLTWRLLLLAATFFFAFFNFILTLRYYNHSDFMLNVEQLNDNEDNVNYALMLVQRGGRHYMFGMRAFYLSLPFGLWLLGAFWMLLGSVILVMVLWYIDFPTRAYFFQASDYEVRRSE